MEWLRDRALTLVLMAMFLLFLVGQIVTGLHEYNATQRDHGATVALAATWPPDTHGRRCLRTGRASSCRWRCSSADDVPGSEGLAGIAPARRHGACRCRSAGFCRRPDAPWPVRRGGWILRLYEHSLGLAFVLLFLLSWAGHAAGRFAEYSARSGDARTSAPDVRRLPLVGALLVRVVSKLAERISLDCVDGMAGGLPEAAMVTGVQTRHAPHAETGR